MEDSDKLWDCLCCCGEDHTIRDGGSHINLIMLRKLARWPYLAAINFLIPESARYPLANAVVCDRCMAENREPKYAMAGLKGKNDTEYSRVPVSQLEDPEFYWPDHHPDRLRAQTLETTIDQPPLTMDEESRQSIEELEAASNLTTGIGRIARGECPAGAYSGMACMFCPYGHMLDCHYPQTCEEARCSHYEEDY